MNNNIFIDGPLNIITIKGMDKEMALIADFHEDAELEKGCNVPDSIHLEKFIEYKLGKTISGKDKLHFFIETIPSNHTVKPQIPEEKLRFSKMPEEKSQEEIQEKIKKKEKAIIERIEKMKRDFLDEIENINKETYKKVEEIIRREDEKKIKKAEDDLNEFKS